MEKIEFTSFDAAKAFFDSEEDARSIVNNSPMPGMSTVHLGDAPRVPSTLTELYAPVNDWYDREERRDRIEYEAALLAMGVFAVGSEVAAEMGYAELAADMFAQGFAGVHAKVANPRAHGLEAVFRAGRAAKNGQGIDQRCRAAACSFRATELTFEDFLAGKYVVRPCPWRMPFNG